MESKRPYTLSKIIFLCFLFISSIGVGFLSASFYINFKKKNTLEKNKTIANTIRLKRLKAIEEAIKKRRRKYEFVVDFSLKKEEEDGKEKE